MRSEDVVASASDWVPLTGAQELIWASQRLHQNAPLYNMAFLFDIHGEISEDAFVAAFGRLITEADALRTVVASVDGVPRQRVLEALDYELPVVDMSAEEDPVAASRKWAQGRCELNFDLGSRLFDGALIKVGERQYGWYLNQHHLITDAWSCAVLYERMESLYREARSGSGVPGGSVIPYAAYLDYERSVRAADTPASRTVRPAAFHAPRLYGRRPQDVTTASERLRCELSAECSDRLRDLARAPGIRALTVDLSLFRLFATALFAYLHRVSGQSRIGIGAPAHNRVTAEFKHSAGLFMEVYPLEVDLDDEETFASLHAKVAHATDLFMRNAKPGRSSADSNRQTNTVLNFIRGEFGPFDGLPVDPLWLHPGHSDVAHHLRVHVHDFGSTGRYTLLFDCNEDVLSEYYRPAVATHFQRVLEAMAHDWQQPIAGIRLLDDDESATVASVNSGRPFTVSPQDVVSQFRQQATAEPDAVALRDDLRQWTYQEVDRLTSKIAEDIEPGWVVGLHMERSAEVVLTMLGVLKAGAAYVPLDPAWPSSRTEFVVQDAGCSLVVCDRPLDISVPAVKFGDLGRAAGEPGPSREISADDLAYVLYTSGSTGVPKGVMIEHGALANYATWAKDFYDRGRKLTFPLFSPLTFDLTVTSIFVPLISGGSIQVYPGSGSPADLTVQRVFEDDAVDIVKLTPSHLALLPHRDFSKSRIKQLIVGGEDLTAAVARRTHDLFGGKVEVHNEYGPTEATVGCVVHTYDPAVDREGSVPIGRPIRNMAAYVLDPHGRPVPFGVPGELWVAGAGVARGYLGQPDLSEERFVTSDLIGEKVLYATGDLARVRPDGTIEYLGRRDDQVKVRGARVELGEIEAAVASHPAVTAAVARVWERAGDIATAEAPVFCSRCGLASNFPGISFDADRVCNQCRSYESYSEKARVYFKPIVEFERVFERVRGRSESDYDCLALLSGGKDSTYMVCRLVDMGLRVLAFTLDNGYISEQAKGNIRRIVEELGVDHIFASTPAMNEIFVDSLQRHANVCQGCFKTIYTLSMQTAKEKRIPYIVTGLSRGQFFETRLTEDLFTALTVSSDQIDANVLESRKAYHRVDDAVHRLLDVSIFEDDRVFDEVRFVDFYRYCDVGLDELLAYLDERVPWVRPTDTGRSTNCLINDVGIYFHRRTRGFHNYALPYSWDVRLGHKTRQEALEELDDDIDVAEVQRILTEIGFPEDVTDFESGRRLVAYYSAPVELPLPELRRHAAETLPQQLVPAHFVHLDAIPLTANGKVDRAALPEPGTSRPAVETVFLAPRSETEIALAHIWEEVIGLDDVGIRDDFFELGGDSIMAIQIVARAHRVGLPITLHDLFDLPTIEHLAQAAERTGPDSADRLVGPVRMTPIQRWFFEQHPEPPGHFHQMVEVEVPESLDVTVLEECLAVLADHHDALRQSFRSGPNGWTSQVAEQAIPPAVHIYEQPREATRPALRSELLTAFDLERAPLMRAGLLLEDGRPHRLVMVAHHLIVDAVSWPALMDDLELLYQSRIAGKPAGLPAITTSVEDWVGALERGAPAIDTSLWENITSVPAPPMRGASAGRVETVTAALDTERTDALIQGVAGWRIGIDELLVAALAATLADSNGGPAQRIFLEGHGRDSDDAALDVTRNIGWFASLYPVVIDTKDRGGPAATARAVRDELRRVSAVGSDYGTLRYLHPDAGVRRRLALRCNDHVVFNYLGRSAPASATIDRVFQMGGPVRLARPGDLGLSFAVEVAAYVDGGRLVVTWTSARVAHSDESDAPARLLMHLGAMMDALSESQGRPSAVGDRRFGDLDETALGKLASVLRSSEGGR